MTRYEGSRIGAGGGCAACAYDQLGNPLAMTDPRGFTTHYDRNELGEVYRTTSPDPYRYRVETHFDANRNAIRTDIEDKWVQYNSDDPTSACFAQFTPSGSGSTAHVPTRSGNGGSIRPGWFVNLTTYDLLDNAIEQDQDATGSHPDRLVSRLEYDANENLIKIIKPEGNIVEYDYDERDLRIAERVGKAPGEDGALTITAYDANGNLLQIVGPAERGGAGNHTTITLGNAFGTMSNIVHTGDFILENVYDGFDRVIESIDAVGNVTTMEGTLTDPLLDPNGRVIGQIVQGPIGGATPTDRAGTNNVDLTRSFTRCDEAGRAYESQQAVFVADGTTLPSLRDVTHTGGGLEANTNDDDHTATVTLVDDGVATTNESYVLTRSVYDRAGRTVEMLADNVGVTVNEYDGANRRLQSTDPSGNIVAYQHDAASNVTLVTRTEKCTITEPAVADEIFLSATRYDSLNRPVVQAAQGADGTLDAAMDACNSDALWEVASDTILTRLGYDSRGNRTLVIDPKGNTSITIYDGASRATQNQQHLRQRGQGTEPPAANQTFLPYNKGSITTTSVFDANSRLTQLIDDRGAPTTFEYDTLDRQTKMIFQDGSTRTRAYNLAGDVVEYTDENGSLFTNTFDAVGRKISVSIAPAEGVIGTTLRQDFQYDGLSRVTLAQDGVGYALAPPSPSVGTPVIKTVGPGKDYDMAHRKKSATTGVDLKGR